MKILILAAHPDDEVLGLGGTLKRHVMIGDRVCILIIANIGLTRYDKKTIQLIEKSTLKSAKHLGINDVRFSNLDDQMLDIIPIINITKLPINSPNLKLTFWLGILTKLCRNLKETNPQAIITSKSVF